MLYRVVIDPEAFSDLEGLDDQFTNAARTAIKLLSKSPKELGRKATLPFAPIGHTFEFDHTIDGVKRWYVIFFTYDQDEPVLYISDVAVRPKD